LRVLPWDSFDISQAAARKRSGSCASPSHSLVFLRVDPKLVAFRENIAFSRLVEQVQP
jgi:hypothetical protein